MKAGPGSRSVPLGVSASDPGFGVERVRTGRNTLCLTIASKEQVQVGRQVPQNNDNETLALKKS